MLGGNIRGAQLHRRMIGVLYSSIAAVSLLKYRVKYVVSGNERVRKRRASYWTYSPTCFEASWTTKGFLIEDFKGKIRQRNLLQQLIDSELQSVLLHGTHLDSLARWYSGCILIVMNHN